MKPDHHAPMPPRLAKRRADQLAMIWDTEKLREKIQERIPEWTSSTVCACCGKQIHQDTPIIWSRDHPGKVWHTGREKRDPFDEDETSENPNVEYNECMEQFWRNERSPRS